MRKMRWMAGFMTAAAVLAAAGCSMETGTGAEDSREGRPEQTTEEKPGDRPGGRTEEKPEEKEGLPGETEKPTHPSPQEIKPFPDPHKETALEPLEGGKRLVLMTDIHYFASSLTDMGPRFHAETEYGDGKLTDYVWEITEAAFEELPLLTADVLVISGDLSLQGELESHKALARKLDEVELAGTQVVVIPGNHDINNPSSARYAGQDRYPAEPTSPEDFAEIYYEFGYGEAASRDSASLSYTYDLGPSMRLLMLDTCQYDPKNKIGGMIGTETYEWIQQELEKAAEDGVSVLPVAHHNLLEESRVYAEDCTIEHSDRLVDMLESENIPLFLSGHLHVQHFMQHEDIGIYEIVTSSLVTPPCQYGVLEYMENDTFSYYTRQVDMEGWARRHKKTDENLLNFNTYSPALLQRIFFNQAYGQMKDTAEGAPGGIYVKLTEEEKQQMASVYGRIKAAYYGGRAVEAVEEALKDPGYEMWNEYCYPIIPYEYLEYMVEDGIRDYNRLSVE